jgi:DNA invertase Pin-like site-specific DNA recombinase
MSTDGQSADSPADQVARCREFAATRGWAVVLVVEDAGLSAASRHARPQFTELVRRIEEWDVLLCWDLSRLARNDEDTGWVRNRLKAAKKDAIAVSTGRSIHDLGSRFEGVIAAEYLEKLKVDTHRGMAGRAARKLFSGGLPFGYRTELAPGADMSAKHPPKRLVVDQEQAEVVRMIFKDYVNGAGLRGLARRLNADGVQSPRGKGWAQSALLALLSNPIYRGTAVWNRSEWIRDHETGKRRRYERPEAEWISHQDDAWVIVDSQTWQRAQDIRAERGASLFKDGAFAGGSRGMPRPPSKHLLSGLLKCGTCGGTFFRIDGRALYGCGWHRDRGDSVCANTLRIPQAELEERVLGGVMGVLTPENALYVVERALKLARERAGRDPAGERARLLEIAAQERNLVDLVAKTGDLDVAAEKIKALKAERAALLLRLTKVVPDVEELRRPLMAALADVTSVLKHKPDRAHALLAKLLAGRRLAVRSDPVRGYAVEGLLRLEIERDPQGVDPGDLARQVAGGRFGRTEQSRRPSLLTSRWLRDGVGRCQPELLRCHTPGSRRAWKRPMTTTLFS